MNSKIYYYIAVGFLILLILGAGAGFYYAAFGNLLFFSNDNIGEVSEIPPTGLRLSADGTLYFAWKELPDGTASVNIYRARKGTEDWKLWKTVQITGDLQQGLLQLQTSGTEDLDDFYFYYEAVDASGNTIWESDPDEIAPYVPPTENESPDNVANPSSTTSSTENGTGSGTSGESGETPTPTTNTSSTEGTTTTPPDNSTTTQPSEEVVYPTGTIFYYTPSGDVSGTKLYDSSFWVEVVNNKLQFGWQDLPEATTKVILERSSGNNGPWSTILSQENPDVEGPYIISLLDAAVSSPFYYRLRSLAGITELVILGPIFIEQ